MKINILQDKLPPIPDKDEWVSLDVEMFGMKEHLLHRPTTGKFACLTVCLERDPNTVYITETRTGVMAFISAIHPGIWAIMNAKFDIMQLRRYANVEKRNKIWDIMLIEQIMWTGYHNTFALNDLARRYLRIKLDKDVRDRFATATEMDDELREYACKDTPVTLQVAMQQRKVISKRDFYLWKTVEAPFMWALLDRQGFRVDYEAWEAKGQRDKERAEELKISLDEINLNPNSPAQVREYLATHGFSGIKNAQADTIQEYIEAFPDTESAIVGANIIEYKSYSKPSSTYGLDWLYNYAEEERPGVWVVFGNYHQIGAETSRTACSDPNMQNIPNDNEHRGKFIARPGNKLIIMDWSQQEPGISAFLSKDKNLLKANHAGDDIYIETARIFFNTNITKKDKRRDVMKAIFLGLSYGLSKWGLAKRLDIDVDEAEKLIKRFMNVIFRDFGLWAKKQKKKKNFVTTILGRKLYLNPYSGQRERNALNAPHQGSGSDMMKIATARIHAEWISEVVKKIGCKYPFAFVAEVHDEIIFDVPEKYAKEIAEWIKKVSIETGEWMCPGVKFRVGIEIGDSWSAKE